MDDELKPDSPTSSGGSDASADGTSARRETRAPTTFPTSAPLHAAADSGRGGDGAGAHDPLLGATLATPASARSYGGADAGRIGGSPGLGPGGGLVHNMDAASVSGLSGASASVASAQSAYSAARARTLGAKAGSLGSGVSLGSSFQQRQLSVGSKVRPLISRVRFRRRCNDARWVVVFVPLLIGWLVAGLYVFNAQAGLTCIQRAFNASGHKNRTELALAGPVAEAATIDNTTWSRRNVAQPQSSPSMHSSLFGERSLPRLLSASEAAADASVAGLRASDKDDGVDDFSDTEEDLDWALGSSIVAALIFAIVWLLLLRYFSKLLLYASGITTVAGLLFVAWVLFDVAKELRLVCIGFAVVAVVLLLYIVSSRQSMHMTARAVEEAGLLFAYNPGISMIALALLVLTVLVTWGSVVFVMSTFAIVTPEAAEKGTCLSWNDVPTWVWPVRVYIAAMSVWVVNVVRHIRSAAVCAAAAIAFFHITDATPPQWPSLFPFMWAFSTSFGTAVKGSFLTSALVTVPTCYCCACCGCGRFESTACCAGGSDGGLDWLPSRHDKEGGYMSTDSADNSGITSALLGLGPGNSAPSADRKHFGFKRRRDGVCNACCCWPWTWVRPLFFVEKMVWASAAASGDDLLGAAAHTNWLLAHTDLWGWSMVMTNWATFMLRAFSLVLTLLAGVVSAWIIEDTIGKPLGFTQNEIVGFTVFAGFLGGLGAYILLQFVTSVLLDMLHTVVLCYAVDQREAAMMAENGASSGSSVTPGAGAPKALQLSASAGTLLTGSDEHGHANVFVADGLSLRPHQPVESAASHGGGGGWAVIDPLVALRQSEYAARQAAAAAQAAATREAAAQALRSASIDAREGDSDSSSGSDRE